MGTVLPGKAYLMGVFHRSYPAPFLGKILLNLLTSTPSVLHAPLPPSDSLPDCLFGHILTCHSPPKAHPSSCFRLKSWTVEPTSHSLALLVSHSYCLIQPRRGSSSHLRAHPTTQGHFHHLLKNFLPSVFCPPWANTSLFL